VRRLTHLVRLPWLAAVLLLLLTGTAQAAQAPIVDDFSASPTTVLPGEVATLTVEAHDPDCASTCTTGCGEYINHSLTQWVAAEGSFISIDNGASGSPYSATADWQAPEVEGVYTVSVVISDSGSFFCGGRQTTQVYLDVQVALTTNEPPVVTELTADPVQLFPGQDSNLSCTATDPDGDPVDYTWEADSGTVTPGDPGSAVYTAASPGIIDVSCIATDPGGLFGTDFVGIAVTGALPDAVLESTLVAPQRLSVSATGEVYVVDEAGGGIRVINLFSGEFVYGLALPEARSVAVDWNDNLLVGMRSTAWLLDRRGDPLLTLGGGEDLGDISDVAVDAVNLRYGVLHRSAGRTLIYDETGVQIAAFGTTGDGPDQFMSPQGLASTPSGTWVVTDPGHGLVKTFSIDTVAGSGTLESSFGELGPNAGEFVSLDDVAVDGAGVIYVSDAFQDWVQAFDPDGTPREALGSYGSGIGEFRTATGLAIVEAFDRLLAASANSSTIQVFRTSDDAIPSVPAPGLDLAPASLSFGSAPLLTQSAPQTITLTNTGEALLGLRGVSSHRDFLQSHNCGSFVEPGGSCAIQVVFRPTRVGAVGGTLVLDTSNPGGPAAILLTGEGFVSPGVDLTPRRLDYSDQWAGTISTPKSVKLTNTGTVSLALGSIETSAQYRQTNDCPVSLASGGVCTVQVLFEPATVADSIVGTLTVVSDAPGGPHSIPLDGRGITGATIVIEDVTLPEGNGEPVAAVFPVSLSQPSDVSVSVDYTSDALTAGVGEDFEEAAGRVVFAPGETSRFITVPILGDAILEPDDETFRIDLTHPVNALIDDAQAVATIEDDEPCPGPDLMANAGAESWPEDAEIPGWTQAVGFWERRVDAPEPVEGRAFFHPRAFPEAVTVTPEPVEGNDGQQLAFQQRDDDADSHAAADGSGQATLYQSVDVSAFATSIDEGRQRFAFEGWVRSPDEQSPPSARIVVDYLENDNGEPLSSFDSEFIVSRAGWQRVHDERTAPPGTRRVRIQLISSLLEGTYEGAYFDALSLRSMQTATIVVEDVAVHEGDSGFTELIFSVTLACSFHREVTLDYATSDGSAVAGDDYLAAAGTLNIPVGQTARTVPVSVVGDVIDEPHRTFSLDLQWVGGEGSVALDLTATGTIHNDDACPRSTDDWAANPAQWPVTHLLIGGVDYGEQDLLNLLGSNDGDASTRLARELAGTRLNLAAGSDPAIESLADQIDTFLEQYPPGSKPTGGVRLTALDFKDQLESYNTDPC